MWPDEIIKKLPQTKLSICDNAWLGDALLSFYVRKLMLEDGKKRRNQVLFAMITSNENLVKFGLENDLENKFDSASKVEEYVYLLFMVNPDSCESFVKDIYQFAMKRIK